MPRDEQRRQKALMKKRSKQKAAKQHSHAQSFASLSAQSILRQARTYPVYECMISPTWQKDQPGLVEIVLARQQPDGDICFGVYLVDKLCLGLKNTFANVNFSRSRYQSEIHDKIAGRSGLKECPLELAHQMIYASIDYARQFGFEPNKDFALSQFLLLPRGELQEPYQITFGKDGKPLYISGPNDNPQRIIRQLEKTAGPGNYDYIAMLGDPGGDFDDDI
ncbi:MAG TPA: hypothetical protein VGT44_04995 [Ktedonobacteraceae bacterium]|nr:hypothetical protein [Ktedonobacteraceae bacterium]